MSKPKTKKVSKDCVVYTTDDLVQSRDAWVSGFAAGIEVVKKAFPDQPIYEYRLVAVHTPPPIVPPPPQYTRKEIK